MTFPTFTNTVSSSVGDGGTPNTMPELNELRLRFSRNAVARIGPHARRPRAVGQDDLDFRVAERRLGRETLIRRADAGPQHDAGEAQDGERDARHVEAGTTGR